LLQQGAACAFANDGFFLEAALSREDLLPALVSSISDADRQRLLLRLCPRQLRFSYTRPMTWPFARALLRSAALRAHLPPLAPWPQPSARRARAKWAVLASFNLIAVAQAEGEAARPLLITLRDGEDAFLSALAQQRLDRLDRLNRQRQAAADGAPPAPTEHDR
jgi:hypothetical protein